MMRFAGAAMEIQSAFHVNGGAFSREGLAVEFQKAATGVKFDVRDERRIGVAVLMTMKLRCVPHLFALRLIVVGVRGMS